MLLKILLVAVSSLALFGCQDLPERPNVYLWVNNTQTGKMTGAPTGNIKTLDRTRYGAILPFIEQNPSRVKVPYESTHKWICFTPRDWEIISVYAKTLRNRLEARISSLESNLRSCSAEGY